jgi:IS1 family transposase
MIVSMKTLTMSERTRILHLLCDGTSIRAITRLTGSSKNTVAKLLGDVGRACMAYHDEHVRNLESERIQVDEAWAFIYSKQKNVATAKAAPDGAGDVWTWIAMDADTKFVASYFVGGRDGECAKWFIDDVAKRLTNRVQLTSDGHKAYLEAVEGPFGADIDYAQLVKIYGATSDSAKGRYSPAECTGAVKTPIEGKPDPKHISTSYIERQNLTLRMHMRRFTRLTNAFSKKVENHAYAVALHMMYHNFVRIHQTLRVTPAMAAGVADRLWEVSDIVALWEAIEPKAGKRGPYQKKQ